MIGGGLSGLACARQLHFSGHQVEVLEASARVGGRVLSAKHELIKGVDLGGAILHGSEKNPLRSLALRHQLPLSPMEHALGRVWNRGQVKGLYAHRYDWSVLEESIESAATWPYLSSILRKYTGLGQATPLKVVVTRAFESWEGPMGEEGKLVFLELAKQSFGQDLDQLSLSNLLFGPAIETAGYGPLPTGESVLPWGTEDLVELIARELPIKYNQKVLAIEKQDRGYRLKGDFGARDYDVVVLALPLGVLKAGDIDFNFPLPRNWRRGIEGLGVSELNKLVMRFDHSFWSSASPWFLGVKEGRQSYFLDFTYHREQPILAVLKSGREARELEEMSLEQAVRRERDLLEQAIGYCPEPLYAEKTGWFKDKHFKGAFSHLDLNSRGDEHSLFGPEVNDLYICGEFAHPTDPGTMHGAYWSGTRVASWIQGVNPSV